MTKNLKDQDQSLFFWVKHAFFAQLSVLLVGFFCGVEVGVHDKFTSLAGSAVITDSPDTSIFNVFVGSAHNAPSMLLRRWFISSRLHLPVQGSQGVGHLADGKGGVLVVVAEVCRRSRAGESLRNSRSGSSPWTDRCWSWSEVRQTIWVFG